MNKRLFYLLIAICILVAACIFLVLGGLFPTSEPTTSRANGKHGRQTGKVGGLLFVNPDNRRYFTDGTMMNGKYRVTYLTGSHTWCDFMDCGSSTPIPDNAVFDYTAYLDFLAANNHNFFRLWRAENSRGGESGDDFWFTPMPYQRSTTACCAFDGGNKFDLNKFNQAYFDRMRQRVIEANNQGIYVSIMLFDGWSVESKISSHNPWKGHPFNLQNNINGIDGDTNHDNQGDETHTLANSQVTALQEAYVRKVMDTVNDLDNVLYEVSNESTFSSGNTSWQYYMINYIKNYEAKKSKKHLVGMTFQWPNNPNCDNTALYNSPADWISLGGCVNLKTYVPPVANGLKVILADTDHLCGVCGSRQWVWKSFTRGENPIFMDIYDEVESGRGLPFERTINDEDIRINLGYVREYANRMNLVAMKPHPGLCSTGYCLANPAASGSEYLVFLPSGKTIVNLLHDMGIDKNPLIYLPADSKVTVDLSASPLQLLVEWFNPANGTTIHGGTVAGGAPRSFTAPFAGDAVLYIRDLSVATPHEQYGN